MACNTIVVAAIAMIAGLAAAAVHAEENQMIEATRIGSVPSAKGAAEYFTGTIRLDPLFGPHDPSRASGAGVTFEPGARTHRHTHPAGQTLIVTACARQWGGGRHGDATYRHPGLCGRHARGRTDPLTSDLARHPKEHSP